MPLGDVVELDAERVGHQGEHRAPGQRGRPRGQQQRRRGVRLAEPHDVEHRHRVVPGVVVDDLHHPDRRAPPCTEREGGRWPGRRCRSPGRCPRCRRRCHPPRTPPGADRGSPPARGAAAARTRCSPRSCPRPACGRCRRPPRRAGRRSGPCSRCSRRPRPSRASASWVAVTPIGLDAADLAGVAAGLVVAVDPQARQLEIGMGGDGRHGVHAHRPGRPLDHADGHGWKLPGAGARFTPNHSPIDELGQVWRMMTLPSSSTVATKPGSTTVVASGCSRMAGPSMRAPTGRSSRR